MPHAEGRGARRIVTASTGIVTGPPKSVEPRTPLDGRTTFQRPTLRLEALGGGAGPVEDRSDHLFAGTGRVRSTSAVRAGRPEARGYSSSWQIGSMTPEAVMVRPARAPRNRVAVSAWAAVLGPHHPLSVATVAAATAPLPNAPSSRRYGQCACMRPRDWCVGQRHGVISGPQETTRFPLSSAGSWRSTSRSAARSLAELVGNDVRVGCAPSCCTATPLHRRLVTAAQAVAVTRSPATRRCAPYDVAIIWAS